MADWPSEIRIRLRSACRRLKYLQRREFTELLSWAENTENLLHISVLLFVPIAIAFVTRLSSVSPLVSFLVYPPLASGSFTLFSNPEGRYSSARRFVGGVALGALSGWVALEFTARFVYSVPPARFQLTAGSAALSIVLTSLSTWALDLEEPTAFSTALLMLFSSSYQLLYVVNITASSVIIAGVYKVWHEYFYERRANLLYRSTEGDDHILVPLSAGATESTSMFAASLADVHEAGKVVLLSTVTDAQLGEGEEEMAETTSEGSGRDRGGVVSFGKGSTTVASEEVENPAVRSALNDAREMKRKISECLDVPVDVTVAVKRTSRAETIVNVGEAEDCELVVLPYKEEVGKLLSTIRTLFHREIDVVVFRSNEQKTEWRHILAIIRRPGDHSHMMLDFAQRLVSDDGYVSACKCVTSEAQLRKAETVLANLVETFSAPISTYVARSPVHEFLADNGRRYDLVVLGARTARNPGSRYLSSDVHREIADYECNLAIVHRGLPP